MAWRDSYCAAEAHRVIGAGSVVRVQIAAQRRTAGIPFMIKIDALAVEAEEVKDFEVDWPVGSGNA